MNHQQTAVIDLDDSGLYHRGRLWTQLMGNDVHVTPGDITSALDIAKQAAASHFCKRVSPPYDQYLVLYQLMMNPPPLYQNGVVSKGGSGTLFGQVLRVVREIKRVLSFQGGGVILENEDMLIVQEREYVFDCIEISL